MSEKLAIHGGTPVRARPFGPSHEFGEEDIAQWLWVDTASRAYSQMGFAQCHPWHWSSASKLQL